MIGAYTSLQTPDLEVESPNHKDEENEFLNALGKSTFEVITQAHVRD
jgi:hypothetical protein